MKIVILDRKTLGYDIDVSVFEKFASVISFDVTKPDETKERIKDMEEIIKINNDEGIYNYIFSQLSYQYLYIYMRKPFD